MSGLNSMSDPFSLNDKTILVTGASSGIGQAVAIAAARAGASVILTARDQGRLAQTLAMLERAGAARHRVVVAELRDAAQVAALVDQCGEIDGVVHSAGATGLAPVRMLQRPMLDAVFEVNFTAPVMLTQRLLFKKRLRRGASLVYLSSIAAHTGTVGVGPYAASKAALEGFVRCLALEVAAREMRANTLSPAMVETPMSTTDKEFLAAKSSHYPLGLGQPEDVANAAVFLLADASRKVTGTTIDLDGGLTWT
ncbi:MAG: short chain dehydrogenase [Massilia sp.]|jgi:NAD(P)-dependent dehydrogenase (short-subunit alcohol dehydrogenase family)|nr:short chain dehydrogenase [Massilia sp.]